MSKTTPKYLLLSLPTSVVPSHHADDALEAISTTVSAENGSAAPFSIPEFKIGTLDALVQQADELAKLESQCQGVVAKVADALRNILDGDEAQIERMMVVNDSMLIPFLSLPGAQLAAGQSGAERSKIGGRVKLTAWLWLSFRTG